jgi:hypothetical protein
MSQPNHSDALNLPIGATGAPCEDGRAILASRRDFEEWANSRHLEDAHRHFALLGWQASMTAANGQAAERIAELEAEVARQRTMLIELMQCSMADPNKGRTNEGKRMTINTPINLFERLRDAALQHHADARNLPISADGAPRELKQLKRQNKGDKHGK